MTLTKQQETIPCIYNEYGDKGPEYVPLLGMYESWSGWYWYITEFYKDDKDVAFGFVHGFEDEWGEIYLPELREKPYVWKVERKDWTNNSRVKMIPRSELKK